MKLELSLLFCLFVRCASHPVLASEWRGIIPLHSLRSDVERILGLRSSGKSSDNFKTKNYNVHVRYVTKQCEAGRAGWNVPIGTVYLIDVIPKTPPPISSLNIELKKFKIADVKDVAGAKIYTDEEDGFEFEYYESKDKVLRLTYFPSVKDAHLRCPQ